MSYTVELTLRAHQDVMETILWYETQRQGLGAEFYSSIERIKEFLTINPEMFEIKYRNNIRWAITERFPYMVVFLIDNNKVVILAVISTYRNPKIWRRRI